MDYMQQPPAIYRSADSSLESKVAPVSSHKSMADIISMILQKYIFHNINTTNIKQNYFLHERQGVMVHSEFLISTKDSELLGRIDYKDRSMMIPSMAVLMRNGRTFVIVYRTERVSRYNKKRDWRNPGNAAAVFEDSTGVLEEDVSRTYKQYQEQENQERIKLHRKMDEELGASFVAAVVPEKVTNTRHFLRQKKV